MRCWRSTGNCTIMHHMSENRDKAGPDDSAFLLVVGERVRNARARRGMSRKILAKDSGVSERYLAQLESGAGNISILLLRQVARAMDLPIRSEEHTSALQPLMHNSS